MSPEVKRPNIRKKMLGLSSIALVSFVTAISPTMAIANTETTFNPFDDAGGFSIYVREDAQLLNHEVEGSVAVGGTLTIRKSGGSFAILHQSAGTGDYSAPLIDGDPTRLLVNEYSPASGVVQAKGGGQGNSPATGYAKIVSPQTSFTFRERGGYTQYIGVDGDPASGPAIEGLNQPWADNHKGETFRTAKRSVAAYVEQGQGFAASTACLEQITAESSTLSHHVTPVNDGGKASITLVAGVPNVIDYADLYVDGGFASQISYAGDVRPSASTPIIVKVPAGTTSIRGMEFGSSGQYASYALWDLSAVTGTITMTDQRGGTGRIDGSVYAPEADLHASFGPLDGQILAKNFTATSGAGETHSYLFNAQLPCGDATKATVALSSQVAVDGNTTKVLPATGGSITDTVSYTGLDKGTRYTLDGKVVTASGTDTGVQATVTFVAEASSGTVAVPFTFSAEQAASYAGQSLVVFEYLSQDGTAVAQHADLSDLAQTFSVARTKPEVPTTSEPTPGPTPEPTSPEPVLPLKPNSPTTSTTPSTQVSDNTGGSHPSTSAAPSGGVLAMTGASAAITLGGVALTLVLVGTGVTVARRRAGSRLA